MSYIIKGLEEEVLTYYYAMEHLKGLLLRSVVNFPGEYTPEGYPLSGAVTDVKMGEPRQGVMICVPSHNPEWVPLKEVGVYDHASNSKAHPMEDKKNYVFRVGPEALQPSRGVTVSKGYATFFQVSAAARLYQQDNDLVRKPRVLTRLRPRLDPRDDYRRPKVAEGFAESSFFHKGLYPVETLEELQDLINKGEDVYYD